MTTTQGIRISSLRNEFDVLKQDYQALLQKYLNSQDVEEKNALKRSMDSLLERMGEVEKQIKDLEASIEKASIVNPPDYPQPTQDSLRSYSDQVLKGFVANQGITYESLQEELRNRAEPRPSFETTREQELEYLQRIIKFYEHWRDLYTDLPASIQKVQAKNTVAERYVEMQHVIFKDIDHDPQTADLGTSIPINSFSELKDAIFKYKRVALVGDPGAGKTTTLQRLAFEFANDASGNEDSPLPCLVSLGAFRGGDFQAFLELSFGGLSLKEQEPSRTIILMDGLNEMPNEFAGLVYNWLKQNLCVIVVATCRKLDYLGYRLPLQRIDVLPLDVERIYHFIGNFLKDSDRDRLFWGLAGEESLASWNWYQEQDKTPNFHDYWYGFTEAAMTWDVEKYHLKQIQDQLRLDDKLPALLGVVRNPFLLFAVILIYIRQGTQPSNKGRLFDLFVLLLMEQRGKPAATRRPPWIEESIQRQALARLAYRIQIEHKSTSVDEDWAIQVMREILPTEDVDQIAYLTASAGLISRSGGMIRFTHQLLQEYFAAYEMGKDIESDIPPTKYWSSENWWEQTGWEETAILLAGMQNDASDVVKWLLPINPTLAYRCVKESGNKCKPDVLRKLYEPTQGARISPQARAEWGRILAKQGDKRSGVGLRTDGLPEIAWVEIPAGVFSMGGDPNVVVAHSKWDGAVIDIDYIYWLSKYPITYAQFEVFVNSDGYTNDKYWTKTGLEWRGDRLFPKYWNDPFWHIPNHPIIGVTWFEAYAFTQWLNTMFDEKGFPAPGMSIRMPTEAEWEKGGRYPDGRYYPWGNRYIPGYANIDETSESSIVGPNYLKRTTAVGMYSQGASSLGIHDLSGSIWEWCWSEWNDPYIYPENNDPSGAILRVLRGGSWFYDSNFARCASRARDHPGNKDYDVGFRLCAAPPNVELRKLTRLTGTKEKVAAKSPDKTY